MAFSASSLWFRVARFAASRLAAPYREALFYGLQKHIRRDTARRLMDTDPRIRAGLFAGLALPPDFFDQGQTNLGHLLGTYEASVQRVLAETLDGRARFVDIGCAVGFYTVGVARRFGLPATGYDTNLQAIAAARALARLNGLEGLAQHYHVPPDFDYSAVLRDGDVVLVDIEGGEIGLFTSLPPLPLTTFLVECHPIGGESPRAVAARIATMRDSTHKTHLLFETHGEGVADIEMRGEVDRNVVVFAGRAQRDCFPCWLLLTPRSTP